MFRAVLGSVFCPVCRSATALKPQSPTSSSSLPPCLSRPPRSFQLALPSMQQRFLSSQRPPRRTPSRMVLSRTVSRPPSAPAHGENGGRSSGGSQRPPRRKVDGPFSGMNRTVANVREKPIRAARPDDRRSQTGHDSNKSSGDRGSSSHSGSKGGAPRPFKTLRMHRALATIGYGQRTQLKTRLQAIESFDQFKLLPSIQTALAADTLRGLVDIKPTPIQRLAIPALLGQAMDRSQARQARRSSLEGTTEGNKAGRQEFLLAAETGSGKTLAYLLPVIDAMKRAEAEDENVAAYMQRLEAEKARRNSGGGGFGGGGRSRDRVFEPHPMTARPRVVVLVPSAELVTQVGSVAKLLSHTVKFKTELLSAHLPPKAMERNLYAPTGVDMVVATPHLLAAVAESDPNVLSRVTHLVIDEADSLLDRSFAASTTAVLERAAPSLQQLVLCSATIPRRLDTYLEARFPRMQRITTPNLHAIPRRVQLGVLDVSKDPYRNNKNLACADAIWSIGKDAARHETGGGPQRRAGDDGEPAAGDDETDVKRIMVFVNEREKTQEVAEFLRSKGIDATALHRDATDQRNATTAALAPFTSAAPLRATSTTKALAPSAAAAADGGPPSAAGSRGRSLPNTKVIVATDLASRGIDTVGVRHVVLYDVPHTTIDFIHRLGRAGRMGRRGRGIVLVGKDDRRDVVAEVRESMYMGQALV